MLSETSPRYPLTDVMTHAIGYVEHAEDALRNECALTVNGYRILVFLASEKGGASPSAISRYLKTSPSSTTAKLKTLETPGLTRHIPSSHNAVRRTVVLTKKGSSSLRDADIVLSQCHESLIGRLPPNIRNMMETGFLRTKLEGRREVRIEEGDVFMPYEAICSYLEHERFFTNIAHEWNLPKTEFRLIVALSELASAQRPSDLANALLLARPTVTEKIAHLSEKRLVTLVNDCLDKRSKLALLSDKGNSLAQEALRVYYREYAQLRESTPSERSLYLDGSTLVVATLRRLKTKQASPAP